MKNPIEVVAVACLLAGALGTAKAQDLQGTLKKVKETGTFTIGHRDSSIPLSYLDDKLHKLDFRTRSLSRNSNGSPVPRAASIPWMICGARRSR